MVIGLLTSRTTSRQTQQDPPKQTKQKVDSSLSSSIAQSSINPTPPNPSSSLAGRVTIGFKATGKILKQVVENASAVKKVCQVAVKSFAAYDLHHGMEIRDRKFTDALKGVVDLIGLYSLAKGIASLLYLFSKATLDQKVLLSSLKDKIQTVTSDSEEIAQSIFDEVMEAKDFNSRAEVKEALRAKLLERKISTADEIVDGITIRQKARPITLLATSILFTLADALESVATLGKWGILNLSEISAQIGNQFPAFSVVSDLGIAKFIGSFASAALFISLGRSAYRIFKQINKISQIEDPVKLEKAYKKLWNAVIDTLSNSVDFISAVSPLLFTINPPLLVAFALVAKGTGLICILLKSEETRLFIIDIKNHTVLFFDTIFNQKKQVNLQV